MGEGFRGHEDPERKPAVPDAPYEITNRISPVERLLAERWEALNAALENFKEQEEEDTFNPEQFMAETMTAWDEQHERSERIDTASPFERVNFLLGLLIEEGAEWSAQKRAAVRRVLYCFAQQSVAAMPLNQQGILGRTILYDHNAVTHIGSPRPNEQKLIDQWMQDTVGGGVK